VPIWVGTRAARASSSSRRDSARVCVSGYSQ